MEDTMKFPTTLLSLVLAGAVFVGLPAQAFQAPADQKAAPAAAKETKWQGYVIRIDQDHSTITIRGGVPPANDTRTVAFGSSTEWTKVGKPSSQLAEIKEGSFLIILGQVNKQGVLQATRIDLRLPKAAR
jgi:hypothetical protein